MERYIVDRFEGDLAVLEAEDGSFKNVPTAELPPAVKRSDCLVFDGGIWTIDDEETAKRAERIAKKMDQLFT